MSFDQLGSIGLASAAAFVLAIVSAVAGFGGGVLLLPVFAALFGLRAAVPMLALTQLVSNASRVWFNRSRLNGRLIGWFALGAVPFALIGSVLLARLSVDPLQRLLGVFLIGVVVWRRLRPHPHAPPLPAFAGVGAGTGLGSALLGSVGPFAAPFVLAAGLTGGSYIGTEAATALIVHVSKLVGYGPTGLLTGSVLAHGIALAPATLLGSWVGKRIADRLSERLFVAVVEFGLLVTGGIFLARL